MPRETKGFTVARCNETLRCRFMNNGEIVFEDMFVPDDHLLVENSCASFGRRLPIREDRAARPRISASCPGFRGDPRICAELRAGSPILISVRAVRRRLATWRHALRRFGIARSRLASGRDDAPDAEVLVNMAKMFASEEIMKVAQHAVELHGGNGIMLDFGIEKVLRDAVIFMHMDATVDISKFKIIKNLFPETAGKYAGPED